MALQPLLIRSTDQAIWQICIDGEFNIDDLNIVKDKRSRTYLSGKVTFTGAQYDYVLNQRRNSKLSMDISYGIPSSSQSVKGSMSLVGEWNYRGRVCTLDVTSNDEYDAFERLLDNEEYYPTSNIEFDYTSWIDNVWGTGAYQGLYDEYVNCSAKPDPPAGIVTGKQLRS